MTRRERILMALSGGKPDRPPIAFDSHGHSLDGVFKHYGVSDKNGLYEKAGIDGFSVWEWNAVMGRYMGGKKKAADGVELDFWGNSSQQHYGLEACDSTTALEEHPWPRIEDFDFSPIPSQVQAIKAKDMVVSAGHVGLGYQMHNMLRGNEKALYDVCDESYMAAFTKKLGDFTFAYLEALLQAGAGGIEVLRGDDDVGTMDRLMISPEMWRRYYKPLWREAIRIIHAYGAKFWFHSCGHIRPLWEDLIEIGVDCWNPFPEYVKGNEHREIQALRKDRLALDGGVSHFVLGNGSIRDVEIETKRVLDLFAPDGGLLIGPSQVFTEDIPTENIVAFFETALSYA